MVDNVTLYAVGDILNDREDPQSMFAHVAAILQEADIAFGQLEHSISLRGEPLPHARSPVRAHPRVAGALKAAGFDVVSFASNHTLDYGVDALLDTIKYLKEQEIAIIGVGKDLDEARKPAIIERNGNRVGFLAYNSILPAGYEARSGKPGCAPIRVWTCYQPIEAFQPGTPSRILTFTNEQDLEAMKDDIRRAKPLVDVLVVSMHWGLHKVPATLAMYQREVGHAAIDAGADLILGHHAHILKPIEVYRGKAIFYSLGNFAVEVPRQLTEKWLENPEFKESWELYGLAMDPEHPAYHFHKDARKTIIAKCVIANNQIEKVSFLPALINKQAEPEVLSREDENFRGVVSYVEEINRSQKIDTRYFVDGDEVFICCT